MLTFDPHPLEVLHPAALPKLIMPFAVKRDVIEGLGVRELVVIPFDEEFAARQRRGVHRGGPDRASWAPSGSRSGRTSASAPRPRATREMLRRPRRVRDPRRAAGRGRRRDRLLDPDPGSGRGRRHGGRPALPRRPVHGRGRPSSSGDQRGRELGFPTANIVPDDRLAIPGHGVYAAFANGVPAAVNVGVRPTFETGRGVLIETYLIDREEDLYGTELRVAFVERLRGEKRFAGRRGADRPDEDRRRGRQARLC